MDHAKSLIPSGVAAKGSGILADRVALLADTTNARVMATAEHMLLKSITLEV